MNTEKMKAVLRARRKELAGHLDHIEHDLDEAMPKDWEDRASERQGDEVLEALGTQELAEVRQIDAALARIADGSYGDCVKCGEPIAGARLELLPATPLCANCAV